MSVQRLETAGVGLNSLGDLTLFSGWKNNSGFHEVDHATPVDTLYIETRGVLFWDAEPNRLNSLKRFAHMLRLRGVALLSEPEAYNESLYHAVHAEGMSQPPERRLATLHNLAARYCRETAEGERVTRLATSTARILFYYEPPAGKDLTTLHEYLLEA